MRKGIQDKQGIKSPQDKSTRIKRIVYIGNFRPPYSTENDIKKSFEFLNWEVLPVQENEITEENLCEVIEKANASLFLLYTRTWASTDRLWRKILQEVKVPTVSFHLDLYLGLDRGFDLGNDGFFMSDFVFSADGGHQKEFKDLGINHFFLPPAVLHESVYLGEKVPKYSTDICFVGSYNYHKEWPHRQALIRWIAREYGERFKLWGATEIVRGNDLNNLYNSVKIVLGDSTYSPNYWSDRIPETLGRGGFLVHPYVDEIEKNFTPYEHFIPYEHGKFSMIKEIIEYYVKHDAERDKIRFAGMEHVRKNHTYINRVEEILRTLRQEKAL